MHKIGLNVVLVAKTEKGYQLNILCSSFVKDRYLILRFNKDSKNSQQSVKSIKTPFYTAVGNNLKKMRILI